MNLDFNGEEELKRRKKEVAREFSNKWEPARVGLENIMFEVAETIGEPLILTNT